MSILNFARDTSTSSSTSPSGAETIKRNSTEIEANQFIDVLWHYVRIASPLHNLTKTKGCQMALDAVKNKLT